MRQDLETEFKNIQDEISFWSFIENNLSEYVFSDMNLMKDGKVNIDLLNTYNTTDLAQNAKGRQYIGPMRFL